MILRVRFAETDQMGVAHHSAFVVWFEAGRVEWLRGLGLSYRSLEDEGVSLAVSGLSVRYRRAARFDDELRLETRLVALGSRGCTFEYALEDAAAPGVIALGRSEHVAIDRGGRAVRIPEPWRSQLSRAMDDGGA